MTKKQYGREDLSKIFQNMKNKSWLSTEKIL